MNSQPNALLSGNTIARPQLISLLRAAQSIDEHRFARQAALAWLGLYPGDLQVNLLYAQALLKAGQPEQAQPVLERISQTDPEYLEAVETLVQAQALNQFQGKAGARAKSSNGEFANQIGWLMALGGSPDVVREVGIGPSVLREKSLVAWSRALSKARRALDEGDLDSAERDIQEALPSEAATPLINATHLQLMHSRVTGQGASAQMLRSLAAYYRQRWPNCLHFSLLLADALMDGGEQDQGVALLHEAAANDVGGQVPLRLWGHDHPYRNLWPDQLQIDLDIPIPVSILAILGWNRLPEHIEIAEPEAKPIEEADDQPPAEGKTLQEEPEEQPVETNEAENTVAETLRSVQSELEKLGARLNRPGLANADGRFPIYVIMTTRHGLQQRYGAQTASILEEEMLRLVSAIQGRKDWGAMLFYADEGKALRASSQSQLERPAARPNDPWALKLALVDLDSSLHKHGERIGALLIVGGPQVVPFHHLPNPVDDADIDVPSDNPYGTSDENYFIPEWPVGRLPDGAPHQDANAQPLLYALSGLTIRHKAVANRKGNAAWYRRWVERLLGWINRRNGPASNGKPSYGITAAVWKQASLTVFRPIGDPRAMRISPPTSSNGTSGRHASPLPTGRLAYFNLHGLVDAPEWYGQRESSGEAFPSAIGSPEDYPVAVQPADVVNSGRAPQVVFTEACYGTNIIDKTYEEALSLKFIQAGTYAIAGSTCISYGSISTPLIAADYLGQSFWSFVKEGLPAGEALRRAKIALAREMHNRQGYLDGEDQKTLISFVLYGDPLAVPAGLESSVKSILRSAKAPANLKTVCDRTHGTEPCEPVPEDIQEFVRSVVKQYLPGMEDACLTMSMEHIDCEANRPSCRPGQAVPRSASNAGGASPRHGFQLARKVITLSKDVPNTTHTHHHYARLTLDAEGKLVKLVVSR